MSKDKEVKKNPNHVVFPNANKGVEVEPGKNWITGLSHEQRVAHQQAHENKWKRRYNAAQGTVGGQQNWSRG
jgi:hypothetical protein